MPSKIRVLDERTINKIAAGEVIENSASCVKELVENALDAKANQIDIEIIAGGKSKILISDNGSGMNPDDALLALERHATSKLSTIEDMDSLSSMGFRGEALASMASVSKLTLKTSEGGYGFEVSCHGGKLIHSKVCAHKKGTSIELKNLFYNVPARKAFQKSIHQDVQEITKMIMHLALAYPHVGFRLISDHKTLLDVEALIEGQSPDEVTKLRIQQFYGEELSKKLISIDFKEGLLELRGFLGPLVQTRPNRTGELFFLNKRFIQSKLISIALESGYGTRLEAKRFPFAFLFFKLDPKLVDVNVHPQKKEVRFSDPFELKGLITKAVDLTLSEAHAPESLQDFPPEKVSASHFSFSENLTFDKPSFSKPLSHIQVKTRPATYSTQKEEWVILPHLLGIFDRYFMVEAKSCQSALSLPHKALDGLLLIDQKRAKERILFDYLQKSEPNEIEVQNLLFAETLEFSLPEAKLLEHYLEGLNRLGVGIRSMKGTSFLIDALPALLETSDVKNILCKILEDLEQFGIEVHLEEDIKQKCSLAMTEAVQFEKKIECPKQALVLTQKLLLSKEPWVSPKGKAIIKCLDQNDLFKLFNRAEK